MTDDVLKTCLYERHVALGAKMEPFAGFLMPIQYQGIIQEHQAVRNQVGIFDVSHMGEILVKGPEAMNFVDYIFTNEIADKPYGQVVYGMMLHENGGTVDDLLVYKVSDTEFFLVVNASNIAKDYAHIVESTGDFDVTVTNLSDDYSEVAVQGPLAESVMKTAFDVDLSSLTFFTFTNVMLNGHVCIVSRTGYTGEDGFEIYSDHLAIGELWDILVGSHGVVPCGLGCRDTLRFEAALPLYGHELSDTISPVISGLGMFVKFDKPNFIGKAVVVEQKAMGTKQKVVGIELSERAIPRSGYKVFSGVTEIGIVTTGYLSISTGKCLAMALIASEFAKKDTPVQIEVRNKKYNGFVRNKQFYKKNYKPKGEKANE